MIIKTLSMHGVMELIPEKISDNRGFFMETFRNSNIDKFDVKQENTSLSLRKGTLRGIHLQLGKYAQAKLVSCIKGKILDIYVDLRKNSKTFGKWGSIILDDVKNNQIFLPKGYGHGYITLVDDCIISYKLDEYYNKNSEYTILWNDKLLNIDWTIENPIINNKDIFGHSFVEYGNLIIKKN